MSFAEYIESKYPYKLLLYVHVMVDSLYSHTIHERQLQIFY